MISSPALISAQMLNIRRDKDTGAIYGSTLNALMDVGTHEGFAAAAIKPSEPTSPYIEGTLYTYNPYPEYNSVSWQAGNQGVYKVCMGPNGPIADLLVYSGHPKAFSAPQMGSYIPLEIDGNLCLERETRLGPYGYQADPTQTPAEIETHGPVKDELFKAAEARDSSALDWGKLQQICYKMNLNRYSKSQNPRPLLPPASANITARLNATMKGRPSTMTRRLDMIAKKLLAIRQGDNRDFHEMPASDNSKTVDPMQDIPELPDKFEDVPPSASLQDSSAMEVPPADDGRIHNVDGDKFNKVESSEHVSESSEVPEKLPVDGGASQGFDHSPKLGFGDHGAVKENPQYDASRYTTPDVVQENQEPEIELPNFAGLPEDTPIVPGLNEDEAKAQGPHGMPEIL
jgi:hypothetical protein